MKKLLAIFLVIFLQNCTNKYQEYSLVNGGYTEKKLSDDFYVVGYHSYYLSNENKTTDFALLRAAEIAINNNKDYFEAMPVMLNFKRQHNRQTNKFYETEREIKVVVNLNPKNKYSEIVFNAQAICSLILSQKSGYKDEDFPSKVECGKGANKEKIYETRKKLDNYYENFSRILKGVHVPK